MSSHNHFTGGQAVAVAGALPWMVGLLSGVGRIYCGGGILARNWVITAAHCLERYRLPFHNINLKFEPANILCLTRGSLIN